MITKGYVYVLKSIKDEKTYVGSTNCIEKRIKEHQSGKVRSTKYRLPIELIYYEEYESLEKARIIEKHYKTCAGRKKLREKLMK